MTNTMKLEMNEAMYIKSLKKAGADIKKFPQLHKMVKTEYCKIEYR